MIIDQVFWLAQMRTLFSSDACCVVASEEMYKFPLHSLEEAAVLMATEARRQEFRAGRAAARAALVKLGLEADPIPVGSDRAPCWPEGVVGSISHCQSVCGAVVARIGAIQSIGLDLEGASPIENSLVTEICTTDDLEESDKFDRGIRHLLPNIVFGAKEAFYKAYYPLTRCFLNFRDVSIEFGEGERRGSFRIHSLGSHLPLSDEIRHFSGRWRIAQETVLAGVEFPANSPGF